MSKPNIAFRFVIVLGVTAVVLALVFGWGALRGYFIAQFLKSFANQVQTVATLTAEPTPWQPQLSATGSIDPVNGAALSAEVAGIVDTIHFESGSDVKAGDVLLTLRPNNDPAVLAQLQAQARLAAITETRDAKQYAAHAISLEQLDTDRATLASDNAQVAAQQALMAEKVVHAPFSGRIGIRAVNPGQFLSAGATIASLEQLDPVYADFEIPERQFSAVSPGETVSVTVDAYPGQSFAGKVAALDSAVDSATRNIEVRATIPNPDKLLRPGMFATVAINTGAPASYITLPETAVAYNPYGDTVYTLTPYTPPEAKVAKPGFIGTILGDIASWIGDVFNAIGDAIYFVFHLGHLPPKPPAPPAPVQTYVAQQVFVTLGDTRGDQVAVVSGLEPGDVVVTAGQVKLHNGSVVVINNTIEPPNSPNPNPPNE